MNPSSAMFLQLHEKLQRLESGGPATPLAPSAIPMSEYYAESERQHNALLKAQQEREDQLKRTFEAVRATKELSSFEELVSNFEHHGSEVGRQAGPKENPLSGESNVATAHLAVLEDGIPKRRKLKPFENPYRNKAAEDASRLGALRPHTIQLVSQMSFAEAAIAEDHSKELRRAQQFLSDALAARQLEAERQNGIDAAQEQSYRRRLEEWRSVEADQLNHVFQRQLRENRRCREQADDENHRQQKILRDVMAVHQKAQHAQEVARGELQRMESLKRQSSFNVARECVEIEETSFRLRLEAAESSVFHERISIPFATENRHMLLEGH
jgi:hypothetical protein